MHIELLYIVRYRTLKHFPTTTQFVRYVRPLPASLLAITGVLMENVLMDRATTT